MTESPDAPHKAPHPPPCILSAGTHITIYSMNGSGPLWDLALPTMTLPWTLQLTEWFFPEATSAPRPTTMKHHPHDCQRTQIITHTTQDVLTCIPAVFTPAAGSPKSPLWDRKTRKGNGRLACAPWVLMLPPSTILMVPEPNFPLNKSELPMFQCF